MNVAELRANNRSACFTCMFGTSRPGQRVSCCLHGPVDWQGVAGCGCLCLHNINIYLLNKRNITIIYSLHGTVLEIWTIYCISKDLKSIRLVLLETIVRKYFGLKNSLDSCEISRVLSVRSFGPRAVRQQFQYLVYRLVMWSDSRSNCTLYRRERLYTVQV